MAAVAVVTLLGCERAEAPAEDEGTRREPAAEAERDAGRDRMAEMDRHRPAKRRPAPPLNETPPPMKLGASHILLMYEGAERSKATRSKAEAQALAQKALARVTKGEDFAPIAEELSDCPSKAEGGNLGAFMPGQMVPAFTKAVESVRPGQLVPEVVESPFGFHVIRREPLMHLGHVLIHFRDARLAPEGIERTREEAEAEAHRVHDLLTKEGADWSAIARERSDCMRSKAVGGDIGYYGRDARLLPEMREATAHLEPGQVSDVIETDYGFHVMFRFRDDVGPGGVVEGGSAPAAEGEGEGPTKAPAATKAPTKGATPTEAGAEASTKAPAKAAGGGGGA